MKGVFAFALLGIALSALPPRAGAAPAVNAQSAAEAESAAVAAEGTQADDRDRLRDALCALIETSAVSHGLPVGFFTRLIWKESRLRGDAVSPKGALGIAQFMPGTAHERGLLDPFDPAAAIPASASFLAELRARFGNLGLAAAAYNAGVERVADWLGDEGSLPLETQDYVLSITGLPAESWAASDKPVDLPARLDEDRDCGALVVLLRGGLADPDIPTARGPWGVQVAGNFSKARAIAAYGKLQRRFPSLLSERPPMIIGGLMRGRGTRPFYRARVPVQTREEGERLCAKLRAAGGSCVVLKT